ncbi:unnamed protein product [Prunus brigantina]
MSVPSSIILFFPWDLRSRYLTQSICLKSCPTKFGSKVAMRDGVEVNYGAVAVVNIRFGHETIGMVAVGANNKAMRLEGYGSHRAVSLNHGLGQEALRRRKAHNDNALW